MAGPFFIWPMRILPLAVAFCVLGLATLSIAQEDTASIADTARPSGAKTVTSAADTTATVRCTVRIDRVLVTDMILRDTIDIIAECGGGEFAGFALKFGVDSRFVDIIEVLPGEVPDSCHWEYFRAFRVNTIDKPGLPRALWQVTALSKFSADSTRAQCLGLGRPASVVRLVVTSEYVAQVPDTTVPIYFFWQDCRDNVISDPSGDRLMVSSSVFDYFPVDSLGEKDVFPTRFGTPQQCIDPKRPNAPRRVVEFHNGGVQFKLEVGAPPADSSSDSAAH
jgi:hypothetical protein